MRSLKLPIAFAAVLCVSAVSAAAAVAAEFEPQSEEMPVKAISGTAGEQEFDFGAYQITCASARGSGLASRDGIELTVRFKSCTARSGQGETTGPATIKPGVRMLFVPVPGEPLKSGLSGPMEISLPGISGGKCKYHVGEPSEGSGAGGGKIYAGEAEVLPISVPTGKLKAFPSGLQQELELSSSIESIPSEYKGNCGKVDATGRYSGILWVAGKAGDLGYQGETTWKRERNE